MHDQPATNQVRVVIGDDSEEVRRQLVAMMVALPSVEVVQEADGARATFEAVKASRPDVVVLDIQMPDGSGIDVLKRIKSAYPTIQVLMLTNHANPFYRKACMKAGADYFFDKSMEFERVGEALSLLTAGPC